MGPEPSPCRDIVLASVLRSQDWIRGDELGVQSITCQYAGLYEALYQ